MKGSMEHSCVQLVDLPDEILMYILKKLINTEVLYSMIDINVHLGRIASDSLFTRELTLMIRSSNDLISSMAEPELTRFCSQILPKIHCKIEELNLESSSMERILLAAEYPNLCALGLFNIGCATVDYLFNDCVFKNHIRTLTITVNDHSTDISSLNAVDRICVQIFAIFTNLRCLNFQPCSDVLIDDVERLTFNCRSPTFFSSTLVKLHVNVEYFIDCLYLLDGRFNQLCECHVNIHSFFRSSLPIVRKEKLYNLKCFSLTCASDILYYDEELAPLLYRMLNLEKLFLNVFIHRSKFLDGNDLNNIRSHMPKLCQFVFSIHSDLCVDDSIDLPSNEDIQHTLKDSDNIEIIYYIDYFPSNKIGQCHIFSQPYTMNYLYQLTNNFPDGLFKFVHKVSLYDERPFDHKFFIRIAKMFPYLKSLTIDNQSLSNNNHCQQSNEDNEMFPSIKYPHLIHLRLCTAHDDYIEQFLSVTKTCLPNNFVLDVKYRCLRRVTYNFTRDTTRINCAKVIELLHIGRLNVPKHFYEYFPHIEKRYLVS